MPSQPKPNPKSPATAEQFAKHADGRQSGVVGEFMFFLRHYRKWWLTPIILVLLLVGTLILLAGTPAGPFIYSLF